MSDAVKQRIVIKGENGRGDQVFEYSTPEELAEKFTNAQTNATRKIEQQDAELTRLKEAENSRIAEEQRLAEIEASQTTGDFDNQKYLNLLATNPAAANDYWFESRFKAKPEQIMADYGNVRQAAFYSTQQQVNAAFLSKRPELLQIPPEEQKRTADAITKIIYDRGWAYTEDNLTAAYLAAKEAGEIKLPDATTTTNNGRTTTVANDNPPTVINSSSSQAPSATDEEEKFLRTAPLAQVREYLEKQSAAQRRA